METARTPSPTDGNQLPVQTPASKPKLLDQVRQAIRARHYSKRTEKSYVDWIKPFFIFHLRFVICHLRNYSPLNRQGNPPTG